MERPRLTRASKDLIILTLVTLIVFIVSYFFDVFAFLVLFFQKHPRAVTFFDEIITGLVTVSIGLAVFAWRRYGELRKETAEKIRLQEELISNAETKAETERIICKQLHCDLEEYRKIERDVISRRTGKDREEKP
ncbi:MAG: hypothetical protein ACM3OC_08095 [Deltaproteobacteria bacterium]